MCHSFNYNFKKLDEVDALKWWKSNQFRFISIADVAKKYLGVQASSAGPERMTSIAGHIFAEKRRKLSVRTFSVIKLNENLLNNVMFSQ